MRFSCVDKNMRGGGILLPSETQVSCANFSRKTLLFSGGSNMLKRLHYYFTILFTAIAVMASGFSSWAIANTAADTWNSGSGNLQGPDVDSTGNDGYTLRMNKRMAVSDLLPQKTEDSYTNELLNAKLTWNENRGYPLEENFDFYDINDPLGENSPKLYEHNSGREFSFENYYVKENKPLFASKIFYSPNYTVLDTSPISDSEVENAVKKLPYVSAPPEGYTSEYKIYSSSEAGGTHACYRVVFTRLRSSTDATKYKKYRTHLFYRVKDEGKSHLTYTLSTVFQNTDVTYDYPTVKKTAETINSEKTSNKSVNINVKFSGEANDRVLNNISLCDFSYNDDAGKNPYYNSIDYDKINSDFDDIRCKAYVKEYMDNVVQALGSNYSCSLEEDIRSDTDVDQEGKSVLGIDTARYPFVKTVFARVQKKIGANISYRNYRVFFFYYYKESALLRVAHNNSFVQNRENYENVFPQIYLRSMDDTTNASTFGKYMSYNRHRLVATLENQYRSGLNGNVATVKENLWTAFANGDLFLSQINKNFDPSFFLGPNLERYFRSLNAYKDTANEHFEFVTDENEIKKYVSNMDAFPYIRFVMARKRRLSDNKCYNFTLFLIIELINANSNDYYSASYKALNLNPANHYYDGDYWPSYKIHLETDEDPSLIYDDFFHQSILKLTRTYRNMNNVEQTSTVSTVLNAGYDYNQGSSTVDEDPREKEYYKYHLEQNYRLCDTIDLSRDYCFEHTVEKNEAGLLTHYFYIQYFRKYAGTKYVYNNLGKTDFKFNASENLLYGGYEHTSSGSSVLTSETLPSSYKYKGYQLIQPDHRQPLRVRFNFEDEGTGDLFNCVYNIDAGAMKKQYFADVFTPVTSDYYYFTYTVKFRPKTDYAKRNAEHLLRTYNFKFELSRDEENCFKRTYSE